MDRIIHWDGSRLPDELRDLPPGSYAIASIDELYYASSMNGNEPALVLTDRAEAAALLPRHPELNRALADDSLLDTLKHDAARLAYGLRERPEIICR